MSSIKQKLTCEEAQLLLSRNLDGDLSKEEVRQLYLHLGPCNSCIEALEEMVGLETNLDELNLAYKEKSLPDSFNKKIMDAVKQESAPKETDNIKSFWEGIIPTAWARPAFSGLVGAAAGILLILFLNTGGTVPSQNLQRFQFHPVEFQEAKDKIQWNHKHTLLPGHTLRQTVVNGHNQPYRFRLQSKGPVNVVVTHDIPEDENDPQHKFILHGTRYASLQNPQQQDAIVIRNEGSEPVIINGFSMAPQDIHSDTIKHDKSI
jgi:hypothetical protein